MHITCAYEFILRVAGKTIGSNILS
jgi:hypothetical protein